MKISKCAAFLMFSFFCFGVMILSLKTTFFANKQVWQTDFFTAKMMDLSKNADFNGFNKNQEFCLFFPYNSCPSMKTSRSFGLCLSLKISLK